ncbi:hypothetical protein [Luteolibacter sp. LG18]|uniref:hypothetical protein n=1 Tax=Luteolibacter sp. LG18 TaxID=2819286 RepID=UPI0030C6F3C5
MLLVLATVAFVSCERHDWEETKKLHESHGAHGAAHGGEHGGHEEAAGHGEKHEGGEHKDAEHKEAEHGH